MPVYPVAYTRCVGFMQVSQDFCSYTKSNMESNYIEKKRSETPASNLFSDSCVDLLSFGFKIHIANQIAPNTQNI